MQLRTDKNFKVDLIIDEDTYYGPWMSKVCCGLEKCVKLKTGWRVPGKVWEQIDKKKKNESQELRKKKT